MVKKRIRPGRLQRWRTASGKWNYHIKGGNGEVLVHTVQGFNRKEGTANSLEALVHALATCGDWEEIDVRDR